jgi:hypothetical protein
VKRVLIITSISCILVGIPAQTQEKVRVEKDLLGEKVIPASRPRERWRTSRFPVFALIIIPGSSKPGQLSNWLQQGLIPMWVR